MAGDFSLHLKPDHNPLRLDMRTDTLGLEIEEPALSVIFAVAPSLLISVQDTTDYLLYYNLSKG